MIFVELFASQGALTAEQRRRVGQDLVAAVMPAQEGAPAEAVAGARAYTQVVIHEPETWFVGGISTAPPEQPRYVVRITVPVAWRKEMSPMIIPAITRVLAKSERDPTRLHNVPHAWIQIMGIPEGSYGIFGRPQTTTDIVRLITQPYRDGDEEGRTGELPPGTALDPVCGMTVPLDNAFRVVEADGITYAFCANACHTIFEQERQTATQ